MEKSRAIELLEHLVWDRDIERNPYGDALNMAIEALKAQLFSENATFDAISRQDALDIFDDYNVSVEYGELEAYSRDRKRLCELPTVQPETAKRIVGKSRDGMTLWYQCDICNEPVDEQDNYCRGCGRRLIDG